MSKYRKDRVNDAVAEELCIALRELSDPRIADRMVSVTHAEVAPDFKTAKIFFSCLNYEKEVETALKNASGALRHALAERLNLRITPELLFVYDKSMENGQRIAELLTRIHENDPPQDGGDKPGASDGAADQT